MITRSGAATLISVLLLASSAQAFCRTHTLDSAMSSCECEETGLPIYWPTPNLSYAFNERGFPGISDADMRATFAKAFATWTDVTCNGMSAGFQITQLAERTSLEVGPQRDEPNLNTIVHFDAARWVAGGNSQHALAITAVWFRENGRIFGSDIMFNGAMDQWGDCELASCGRRQLVQSDLQNVATHEVGHFFGLAHTKVKDATMECDADSAETLKRTLESDDIAGFCAMYPPGESFLPEDTGVGCTLGGTQGGSALALLAFAAWLRRRRAR